jgi:hypothetical protein
VRGERQQPQEAGCRAFDHGKRRGIERRRDGEQLVAPAAHVAGIGQLPRQRGQRRIARGHRGAAGQQRHGALPVGLAQHAIKPGEDVACLRGSQPTCRPRPSGAGAQRDRTDCARQRRQDYANDIGWIGGAEAVSAMTIQFNTSGWNA